MDRLRRIDRGLAKAEERTLFVLLLGLLGLAVLQVLWRNIVQPYGHRAPLLWIDEILKHGTLVLGLLGASLATHADRHIRLDLLTRLYARNRRLELAIGLAVRTASLIICFVVVRAGVVQVALKEESLESVLQPWHWQLTVPVAFALIAAHMTARIALDIGTIFKGSS